MKRTSEGFINRVDAALLRWLQENTKLEVDGTAHKELIEVVNDLLPHKSSKTVIILRGIPGSGKTMLARDFEAEGGIICSSDEFFTNNETGEYKFDPAKREQAHAACFFKYIRCLQSDSHDLIVVDSTNIHLWEYRNYIQLAKGMGCKVEIHQIRVTSLDDFALCAERNNHNVPLSTMLQMATEWEEYPVYPPKPSHAHSIFARPDDIVDHAIFRPTKVEVKEKAQ